MLSLGFSNSQEVFNEENDYVLMKQNPLQFFGGDTKNAASSFRIFFGHTHICGILSPRKSILRWDRKKTDCTYLQIKIAADFIKVFQPKCPFLAGNFKEGTLIFGYLPYAYPKDLKFSISKSVLKGCEEVKKKDKHIDLTKFNIYCLNNKVPKKQKSFIS